MTDLSKYPLVGKIMGEQDELFRFLSGDKAPVELTSLQERIATVIDENVDRTDSEKEALIVGSVIALAPPFLMDDPARFGDEYSAEVKTVIDEMVSTRGRSVAPTNLAQMSTAIGVVMMEDLVNGLRDGTLPVPREVIADAFSKASEDEKLVFPNLNAPKLEALYNSTKQNIADELAKSAPASEQDNAPSTPKKKNNGNFDLG